MHHFMPGLGVWILLCLLAAGCTGSASRELNELCKIAMDVEKVVAPAEQGAEFAKEAASQLSSARIEKILQSIAKAEPAKKYDAVLQAARAEGLKDWGCPALERMFGAGPAPAR
jgi:tRNA 2-selenouridine synthase SelU